MMQERYLHVSKDECPYPYYLCFQDEQLVAGVALGIPTSETGVNPSGISWCLRYRSEKL